MVKFSSAGGQENASSRGNLESPSDENGHCAKRGCGWPRNGVLLCFESRGVEECGQAAREGSSEPKEDHRRFSGRIVGVADTSFCGNPVPIKLASADQERFPNQQTQHDRSWPTATNRRRIGDEAIKKNSTREGAPVSASESSVHHGNRCTRGIDRAVPPPPLGLGRLTEGVRRLFGDN